MAAARLAVRLDPPFYKCEDESIGLIARAGSRAPRACGSPRSPSRPPSLLLDARRILGGLHVLLLLGGRHHRGQAQGVQPELPAPAARVIEVLVLLVLDLLVRLAQHARHVAARAPWQARRSAPSSGDPSSPRRRRTPPRPPGPPRGASFSAFRIALTSAWPLSRTIRRPGVVASGSRPSSPNISRTISTCRSVCSRYFCHSSLQVVVARRRAWPSGRRRRRRSRSRAPGRAGREPLLDGFGP